MYPTYTDLAAHQEQHEDRLRRAEFRWMLASSGLLPAGKPGYRQAINWFGTQLITLGARMQQYGAERQVVVTDRAGCARQRVIGPLKPS